MGTQGSDTQTTQFGFRQVDEDEKDTLVASVFSSVAGRYDLMNDLMSLGSHRLWKDFVMNRSSVRSGHKVLDVATGTADLVRRFAERVGPEGRVVGVDINPDMLAIGRSRLIDAGITQGVELLIANAEKLPFVEHQFDCVTIAFGLRNVTRIPIALQTMTRMLRSGGRILVLEFSQPRDGPFARWYDHYSFKLIPPLGRLIAGDAESYRYLVESIRRHPDQETLKDMMLAAGLEDVSYHNLSGGVVALHIGFRY